MGYDTCQLKNKTITDVINYLLLLTNKILYADTTGAYISGFQGTRSGHVQVNSIVLG